MSNLGQKNYSWVYPAGMNNGMSKLFCKEKKHMKMKMIFAGLLLGAAVALQAQVTFGGSVDMVIVPLQVVGSYEDEVGVEHDAVMGAGIGGIGHFGGPRIRLDARAVNADHNIGMRLRVESRAGGTGNPDFRGENFLQAWWSPLDQLRIDAGRFDDDRLRGRIGDDEMAKFTQDMGNQDHIFSRFRMRNGLMLSVTPVDGLLLVGGLRSLVNFDLTYPPREDILIVNNRSDNADPWRNVTFAAGYTIPDIGLIRAQFIGNRPNAANTARDDLEFAFALTAVDGLLLDLGCTINLFHNDRSPDFGFSLGARFRADALEVIGRVDTSISGNDGPLGLNAHLWPSFQIGGTRAILNFGVNFVEGVGDDDADVTLGAGLSLMRLFVGSTRVRGGVAFAFPTDHRPMTFTIPLFLEYSF